MKTRWRFVAAAVGALVVVIVALLTGGSTSGRLPRPPVVAAVSAQSASHSQTRSQLFTPASTIPLTGCTVSAIQGPVAGRSGEVVTVQTAPGAFVRLQAHYSRFTSVHSGQAGNNGAAVFSLADPPTVAAETVRLDATAILQKEQKTCQGTFTPHPTVVGCTVWASNPAPAPGPTTEIITVRTTPGASVRLTAKYLRFTSVHRRQASSGTASFYLSIAHPTPGYPVRITAAAYLWSTSSFCSTSFTPR